MHFMSLSHPHSQASPISAQEGKGPGTQHHKFYVTFNECRLSKLQPMFQIMPPTPNLKTLCWIHCSDKIILCSNHLQI